MRAIVLLHDAWATAAPDSAVSIRLQPTEQRAGPTTGGGAAACGGG